MPTSVVASRALARREPAEEEVIGQIGSHSESLPEKEISPHGNKAAAEAEASTKTAEQPGHVAKLEMEKKGQRSGHPAGSEGSPAVGTYEGWVPSGEVYWSHSGRFGCSGQV